MAKTKIVFFDIKEFEEKYLLEHKIENCEYIFKNDTFHDYLESDDPEIMDADIISVFTSSRVSDSLIAKFPNLKLITTRSTGYNNVVVDYCASKNIPVVNVPKYGDITVAEFAFGLLLNVIRKINIVYEKLKTGSIDIKGAVGHDLCGKTIGIIGTGAIGRHFMKIARGFGMNIIAYDPFPKKEMESLLGMKYVELDELFRQSDIISVHCPATKETHHLVNEDAFNKMKKGVVLINTARGEIVDTEALYNALKNDIVSGAGLDVLECENLIMQEDKFLTKIDCIDKECLARTLINNKLVNMPNVIVTPHVAFDSYEAIQRILDTTINNINGFLSGNIINKVN